MPATPPVFASALQGDALQITMYGEIGRWPLDAASVSDALNANPGAKQIHVRLDSPGGDVFAGSTIRARLAAHPSPVTVFVDGCAASAAATVAMAGDKIIMAEGAMMMIHNCRADFYGATEADLIAGLDMLRGLNAGMRDLYAKRMGKSAADTQEMLDATTWLTAKEAVKLGLADEIAPGKRASAHAWDWTERGYAPPTLTPEALTSLENRDKVITMTFPKELLDRLGLKEGATEIEVYAALDARLAAQDVPAAPANTPAPAQAPDVAALVVQAVSAHAAAAAASIDVSALHASSVTAAVERFIGEGKIPPSNRDLAIKACGSTAAQLSACVAYWTSAPKVLASPVALDRTAPAATALSAAELKMAAASGIDPKRLATAVAEYRSTFARA